MTDIPTTMRALRVHAYDGESMQLDQVDTPRPGRGQVLVRVAATPLNPSDAAFVRGQYGFTAPTPAIPGFEASGTVVASGGGLYGGYLVGKRVSCAAVPRANGTWAEYMVTNATNCRKLPAGISDEAGAMFFVNPLTALALFDIARRGGHRAAIQTAAASALGRMLVRLSVRAGYPMIHVVRRPAQVKVLADLGAEHVIDTSTGDHAAQLKELARSLNATIAFDAVAGPLTGVVMNALPKGSRVLVYGALSYEAHQIDPGDLIFNDKRLDGFWLSRWVREVGLVRTLRTMAKVERLLGGELTSDVAETVGLDEIPAALSRYESDMSRGKVLVKP